MGDIGCSKNKKHQDADANFSLINSAGDGILPYDHSWSEHIAKNKTRVSARRNLVYPSLMIRLGIKCSRDMQCYIVVKSHANGKVTIVGKTNTILAAEGDLVHFRNEIPVVVLVGIDDNQFLDFDIMDGDSLGVSDGYFFESIRVPISKLTKSKNNVFPVHRKGDPRPHKYPLVDVYAQVRLETAIQSVSMHTKDPNRLGFFHFKPPTKDEVRYTTPSFTQTFGTYILRFQAQDVLNKRSVDSTYINKENTAVFLKIVLSDPEEIFVDTNNGTQLQCLLTTIPQYMKNSDDPTKMSINFPELKISHADLTGETHLTDIGSSTRRLIFQLWVQGLDINGLNNCGPRLLSYASICIKEFIEHSQALEGDEFNVCKRLEAVQNESMLHFSFKQHEDLSAKKRKNINSHTGRHNNHRRGTLSNHSSQNSNRSDTRRKSLVAFFNSSSMHSDSEDSFDDELDAVQSTGKAKKENKKLQNTINIRLSVGAAINMTEIIGTMISTKEEEDQIAKALIEERACLANRGVKAGHRNAPSTLESRALHFQFGNISLGVGRGVGELVVHSGDSVYEENLDKKWKRIVQAWNEDNQGEFQKAVDEQRALTSRHIKDIEVLLSNSHVGIIPTMLLDVNSASLQHVCSKFERIKQDRMRSSGLKESTPLATTTNSMVLEASLCVYQILGRFVSDHNLQLMRAYAGGGVNPPSEWHPSRGYSRSRTAFPLCQELLIPQMTSLQHKSALEKEPHCERDDAMLAFLMCFDSLAPDFANEHEKNLTLMGLSPSFFPDSIQYMNSKIWKRIDPRGDLRFAVDRNGVIDKAALPPWGYLNDNSQVSQGVDISRSIDNDQEFMSGFMEACTLYEPSILTPRAQLRYLNKRILKEGNSFAKSKSVAWVSTESENDSHWEGQYQSVPAPADWDRLRVNANSRIAESAAREKAAAAAVLAPPSVLKDSEEARIFQQNKIKYQACMLGLGLKFTSTAEELYGVVPRAMQYEYIHNQDPDALELLLQSTSNNGSSSAHAPPSTVKFMNHAQNASTEFSSPLLSSSATSTTSAASVANNIHMGSSGTNVQESQVDSQRTVVWVLGKCPSAEALIRIKSILIKHMTSIDISTQTCLLMIVFAAEPRLELPKGNTGTLLAVARPFNAMESCWKEAVKESHAIIKHRWRLQAEEDARAYSVLCKSQEEEDDDEEEEEEMYLRLANKVKINNTIGEKMYDSEATSVDTAAETEVDSGAETEIDDRNSKHSPTRTSSPPQVYINPSHSHAHYKESTDRKFTSQKKLFHHPITAPSDRELIERKFVRKDNEKRKHGSLFHHATNNCMMAHYLTWAEIVGQAFDLENQMEDEAEKEKKKDVEKENTVDVKGLGQLSGNANKEAKGLCIDIDIVSKTTPKTTPKTNKNMIFSNMGESNTPISHATTSNLSDTSPSGGVWDRVSPKSRLDALEAKNKEHLDNEDRVKREKEEANKGKRALAMESFEKESTNTPGCVYLKIVMKDYFQSWIGSKVIGRLEADVTTTDVLNTFEINPSMVEKASAKTNISATANSTAGPSSNEENETRVKHDDDPMADADEAAGLLENNSVHSDLTDENDVAGLGSDPFQTLFNQRRNKDMGSLSGFHKLSKIIQNSINIHTNGQNKGGKISNMDKESGKSKNSKSDYYYSHISMSGDAGDDDNDDDDDDEKEAFEKQTVEARNAHRRARVLAEGQLSAGDDKQWISDRVSTLSELSEMKARFDEERKSRFVAEVQNVLSSFLQSVHILLINSVHMTTKSVEHEEEEEKYNKHKLDPFHDHDCDVDREMKYWETVHDFNSGVSFTRHEDHQKVHINRDKEKHHLRDADNEGFLGCNSV